MADAPLDPRTLAPWYSASLRPDRILLTGHSHQAWPDVAREGQLEAFALAAMDLDEKWGAAFRVANDVRTIIAGHLGARGEEIALGASTHDLALRFLSALDLKSRPRLVTTSGEFHSLRRQLGRLAEAKLIELVVIDAHPVSTLAERLAAATTAQTAAVLCSTVLFETSEVVPHIPELVRRARHHGAEVLLDAYHAFLALPFSLHSLGAQDAFVVAGGYKYAQWGEGNCFLRVPAREFRPMVTGWFAEFDALEQAGASDRLRWGTTGAAVFAGATYDPTSHFRARAVAQFFEAQGMTPAALRELSLRQTDVILRRLESRDVVTPATELRGAFVSVRHPRAGEIASALRARGVWVDNRGALLRIGPAPYVDDEQLERALATIWHLL